MRTSESDAVLCAASGKGDEDAFVELVRRYQSAVCAVTFAATGRRDLSEDLAQETFIVAWGKLATLEAPDKVGAWLCGVARNLSRKSARRRDPAPLPDGAEDAPMKASMDASMVASPPDPELAMVDQQRSAQLWDLLGALPVRYREAMVLYYREDQSGPRVAQLLGISVAAAEQRLSRGRRLLRAKVDRQLARELSEGRPRDAFTRRVAAALPLAVPTAAPGGAPASPTLLGLVTKAVIMNKIIAAAALLLAVIAGYALLRPDAEPSKTSAEVDSQPRPRLRTQPGTVDEDESAAGTVVRGIVVASENRDALPGSVVTIVDLRGRVAHTRAAGEAAGLAVVRTDDAGRFSVAGLAPGRYRAAATAPGRLPTGHAEFVVAAEPPDELELTLAPGGHTLRGTVSDVGGGAVHGAIVVARGGSRPSVGVLTNAEGAYALTLPDGPYTVTASDDAYQPADRGVSMRGADQVLDLRLIPGAAIFGTVIDRSTGKPVADAVVGFDRVTRRGGRSSSRRARAEERAVSDGQGRFALRRLGAAEYQLQATADHRLSLAPTEVSLAIAEQRDKVVIFVDPGYNVSGRVVDRANPTVGVPNIDVEAAGMGNLPPVPAKSDADGNFTLRGLQTETYSMLIRGEGIVVSVLETRLEMTDADVTDYVLEVDRGTTVRGTVTPASVADVRLAIPDGITGMEVLQLHQKIRRVRGPSNAEGAFELTGVPVGDWALVAEATDGSYAKVEVTVPTAGLSDVSLTLAPRASVRGFVHDSDGTAMVDAVVRLAEDHGRPGPPGRGATATTDDTGAFVVLGVDDGKYRLTATTRERVALPLAGAAPGDPGHAVTVVDNADQEVRLTVAAPESAISGVVHGPDGAPHADAWVTIAPVGGDPFHESRPPVLSDTSGRFEFEGLGKGSHSLHVSSRDGNAIAQTTADAGDDVVVTLSALGTITGRVTAGGKPVQRFEVSSQRTSDSPVFDDDGRFEVERVTVGKTAITVTAPQGSATQVVDVVSGTPTRVDFELDPWGSVTGRVVNADGDPVSGVAYTSHAHGGERDFGARLAAQLAGAQPTTGADGRFTLEGIGTGRISISFEEAGSLTFGSSRGAVWGYVASGRATDLGDVIVVDSRNLDKASWGDLGVNFAAGFEPPPMPGSEPAPPAIGEPSGPAQLWIRSIASRGPAAGTSLAPGQRVVEVCGRRVEELGAGTTASLADPRNIAAGERCTIVVESDSGRHTVPLVATALGG